MKQYKNVDAYIADFHGETRQRLEQTREIIGHLVPEAEELISYGMPAYKLGGMLVYFAGYARHTGFYPMPSAIAAFEDRLKPYKRAKGSVQFPHSKPLPVDLIADMVKYRVAENAGK